MHITPFFIRALALFPLCLSAWYFLGEWQVRAAAQFAARALPYVHPFANYEVKVEGTCINFLMLVPPNSPDPGWVRGKSYPLLQLSGVPLYTALMLATPHATRHRKSIVTGILTIFLIGLVGVVIEGSRHLLGGLVMLNVDLNKLAGLPHFAPFFAKYLELLTMLLLPLILPIAIWAGQRRDFLLNICTTPKALHEGVGKLGSSH